MLRFFRIIINNFFQFLISLFVFSFSFLLSDLKQNKISRNLWETATTVSTGISVAVISCLVLNPLGTFYFESSYIGEFFTIVTFIILVAILNIFFISKEVRYKRYTIIFKLLTLPISVLTLIFLKDNKLIKDQLYDKPRSSTCK